MSEVNKTALVYISLLSLIVILLCSCSIDLGHICRFGVTYHDPANVQSLPRHACPYLTKKDGFWAEPIPSESLKENDRPTFTFFITNEGIVIHLYQFDFCLLLRYHYFARNIVCIKR